MAGASAGGDDDRRLRLDNRGLRLRRHHHRSPGVRRHHHCLRLLLLHRLLLLLHRLCGTHGDDLRLVLLLAQLARGELLLELRALVDGRLAALGNLRRRSRDGR